MFTLFPQHTYFHSDPNPEQPNFVNEHVLYPTLSWTSFYHFTNSLSVYNSPYNTPYDNELCSTQLYHGTTALNPKQFTQIGYQHSLIRFTAPNANKFSIDHYDHNLIRANEDTFLDTDRNASPQLIEKFFNKTKYVFTLKSLDKKYDHQFKQHFVTHKLTTHTLTNLKIFHKHFVSLHPKNVICTVHTTSCYA